MQRWLPTLHLARKSVAFSFSIALLITLIAPIPWRLNPFLGPLVIALYNKPPLQVLWLAAGCGLIVDLFAAPYPMGLYATAYLLAAAILLKSKNYFFADSPSTLPILTALGAIISTILLASLLAIWQPSFTFFSIDIFLLAIGDSLLATLLFVVPALCIKRI